MLHKHVESLVQFAYSQFIVTLLGTAPPMFRALANEEFTVLGSARSKFGIMVTPDALVMVASPSAAFDLRRRSTLSVPPRFCVLYCLYGVPLESIARVAVSRAIANVPFGVYGVLFGITENPSNMCGVGIR